jgi:hypothetical protein
VRSFTALDAAAAAPRPTNPDRSSARVDGSGTAAATVPSANPTESFVVSMTIEVMPGAEMFRVGMLPGAPVAGEE